MKFLFDHMADDLPTEVRRRFIPYIQLHEFESLLFSDISVISKNFSKKEADMDALETTVGEFQNPEDINTRPDLAPSKRLISAIPSYEKVVYGACLANDIGLERILERCPLFSVWYSRLTHINN